MPIIEEVALAIEELRDKDAIELVKKALAEHVSPVDLLNKGVLQGMKKIGEKFSQGEYFLAELVMGGEMGKQCIGLITPHFPAQLKRSGVVIIGAVKGDIHSIGKDLVAMQLSVSGYEVHDLGIDVPTMKFIEKAKEVKADIIGQSAFLTSTIPYMADLVKYLKDMGLRDQFKVIIGGTMTSAEYARSIGADGWAKDCFDAVSLCNQLMQKK